LGRIAAELAQLIDCLWKQPWLREQRIDANVDGRQRKRLTSVNSFRRAIKARRSGRKNALLKRPIGGSGSK
jgi:hypothetical protein